MKLIANVAFKGKQAKTAIYLIENYEEIDGVLPTQTTWIHRAVEFKNIEVAKYPINKGCNVNARDGRGLTALVKASGDDMAQLLKNAGGQRTVPV